MGNTQTLGGWGEERAAAYLQQLGFVILDRNYHSRYGELDIVAADDRFVVFAEVKLRKNANYGYALEAVTRTKQQKLWSTAALWLQSHDCRLQPRFDVIEVYAPRGVDTINPVINHLTNAFIGGQHEGI